MIRKPSIRRPQAGSSRVCAMESKYAAIIHVATDMVLLA
jgi:hypothetical protein